MHEHRADDDEPLHDELNVRVDVLKLQNVRQQAEDQDADESAGQSATPPANSSASIIAGMKSMRK